MNQTTAIATHLRQVYQGGNWTWSNLQSQLDDVSLAEATAKIGSLNTIAALTFHIAYFVEAITKVLKEGILDAHDKFSYEVPAFEDETAWQAFKTQVLEAGEALALLIEQVPDSTLEEVFVDEKYKTYHRNFWGLIEHTHYHLGQIAVIKKLVKEKSPL